MIATKEALQLLHLHLGLLFQAVVADDGLPESGFEEVQAAVMSLAGLDRALARDGREPRFELYAHSREWTELFLRVCALLSRCDCELFAIAPQHFAWVRITCHALAMQNVTNAFQVERSPQALRPRAGRVPQWARQEQ